MTRAEIESRVRAIFARRLNIPAETIDLADDAQDLGMDSLNAVDIALDLESAFGVQISHGWFAGPTTVARVVDMIEYLLRDNAMAGIEMEVRHE